MNYAEDTLVQQTTADYLEQQLGWTSVYAYNNEEFGPNSLLGRTSDRELWVRGDLYRRRADIIGFVNGLPLLFIECKNIHRNLKTAFEQNFSDYLDTVPHLFHHNAIVMFGNG